MSGRPRKGDKKWASVPKKATGNERASGGDDAEQEPRPDHDPEERHDRRVGRRVQPDVSLLKRGNVGYDGDQHHMHDEHVQRALPQRNQQPAHRAFDGLPVRREERINGHQQGQDVEQPARFQVCPSEELVVDGPVPRIRGQDKPDVELIGEVGVAPVTAAHSPTTQRCPDSQATMVRR